MATILEQEHLTPRSALRHRPLAPVNTAADVERLKPRTSRAPAKQEPHTTGGPPSLTQPNAVAHPHWVVHLAIGIVIALLAVLAAQALVGWASTAWNDLHYGRPRTFQVDAFVGHESGKTPSHFLVVNLHGQIDIIELPGGEAAQTRIFVGPQLVGAGSDLVVATIRFVGTHHDHHPDLYLQAGSLQVIYRNTGGTFVQQ